MKQSSENLKSTLKSVKGTYNHEIPKSNKKYYENINPIEQKSLNEKIKILNEVNNYLRSKDDNIKQVTANFLGEQKSVEIIRSEGKASTSFLQRKLQIGYNRAARIIDMMESDGIVSKANHVGKRDVL